MDELIDLSQSGIRRLFEAQRAVLENAGIKVPAAVSG